MQRGDHLVSPRTGYSHHGLYLGKDKVIHYTGFSSGRHKGRIAITSLEEFCAGEGFSIQTYPFRMYTHEESAKRALSRLGEDWYDILLNNCEHFISWCILGVHHSHQANSTMMATMVAKALLNDPASTTVGRQLVTVIGKEVAKRTVGTTAGIAFNAVLPVSSGVATALAGGAAASAVPMVAVLVTGVVIGLGVTKLVEWLMY